MAAVRFRPGRPSAGERGAHFGRLVFTRSETISRATPMFRRQPFPATLSEKTGAYCERIETRRRRAGTRRRYCDRHCNSRCMRSAATCSRLLQALTKRAQYMGLVTGNRAAVLGRCEPEKRSRGALAPTWRLAVFKTVRREAESIALKAARRSSWRIVWQGSRAGRAARRAFPETSRRSDSIIPTVAA